MTEVRMLMGSVWAHDCDACGGHNPDGGWMVGVATINERGQIVELRTYSLDCYAREVGVAREAVEAFSDAQDEMRRMLTKEAHEEAKRRDPGLSA